MAKKQSKPYVYYDTIWKGVGGGLSNPGESRICKVGKHTVLLSRANKLDRYGNPIHTASLIKGGRTVGYSAKSNGSATLVVSNMLSKNGIDTKRHSYKNKRSKK